MTDIVNPLFQWLNANPELAGLATFGISAAESVAVIGTIVPGTVTMTAIGTLAGAGVIPLWSTIIWAILGAIVGDGISYWLGYYFKDRIRNMWPFNDNPAVLQQGEKFVHKYGVMSVFIGRFIGPIRALVPVVAGMLGMKPLQFTIANIASAIGWAPAYMFPGILLGAASLELPPDIAMHVILVLFMGTLGIVFCFWFIYKILQLIHLQIDQMQNWVWEKCKNSSWLSCITYALRHHDPERKHGQLNAAIYLGLILIALALLSIAVKVAGAPSFLVNDAVFHLARGIRNDTLDTLMINITLLGQSQILFPVITVMIAWLLYCRRFSAAIHTVLLTVLTAGGVFVLKHFVQSPRPWGIANQAATFSMPSGHATLSTALYVGIAYLIAANVSRQRRFLIYVPAFILVFLVCLSRVYLGAHWFTDVIGGCLLGSATLLFTIISYERHDSQAVPPRGLFLIGLITLCISYGYYHHRYFTELQGNHTLENWPVVQIADDAWWRNNNEIPTFRTSLFGFRSQRINLEWAGNIDSIRNSLSKQGWSRPPARDWVSTLHRIADISSTQYLPLISPQYLDKKPALIMTRTQGNNKQLLVIRLWDANRVLQKSRQPLYVGFVGAVPRSYSWILKKHTGEITPDAKLIFSAPQQKTAWEWKLLTMAPSKNNDHPADMQVLLIRPKK